MKPPAPLFLRAAPVLLTLTLLAPAVLAHDPSHMGFSEKLGEWTVPPGANTLLKFDPYQIEVPGNSFSSTVKVELLQGKAQEWQPRAPNNTRVLRAFALVVTDLQTGKHVLQAPKLTLTVKGTQMDRTVQVWPTMPGAAPLPARVTSRQVVFPVTHLSQGWLLVQPQKASGGVTVHMLNMQFQPAHLTVNVGQQVQFVQQDTMPHNVVVDGVLESPPTLKKGDTFFYTFNTRGTFQVFCEIHPGMRLTVTVK